ncbi:hypothetical protein ZWY2020_027957 [Hordeum vulgare]|nr:hypothetical protein ZWY2020_027957 [Hordeum vulgare]
MRSLRPIVPIALLCPTMLAMPSRWPSDSASAAPGPVASHPEPVLLHTRTKPRSSVLTAPHLPAPPCHTCCRRRDSTVCLCRAYLRAPAPSQPTPQPRPSRPCLASPASASPCSGPMPWPHLEPSLYHPALPRHACFIARPPVRHDASSGSSHFPAATGCPDGTKSCGSRLGKAEWAGCPKEQVPG